jgi:TPR repeat protein
MYSEANIVQSMFQGCYMFKKVLSVSLLLSSFNSMANVSLDPNFTLMQERAGLKLFEQGKYQEAFEKLSELAAWGYKDSQYALAFLFLKGQHVEQSTLIGMGWLAMAAE